MNKSDTSRKALGRGLGSLLPTRAASSPATEPPEDSAAKTISIDTIDPNPLQPRRVFQSDRLGELAQSIRANGIIQPLVVRMVGDRYQLVAGERRWRAAKLAGIEQVQVLIRDIPDERLLEVSLIENIQREDLNPIETAAAFDKLGRELNLTAEQVGLRTGKDRSTVLNFQRLLQLPPDIQQLISERRLTAGHGRCLLTLPNTDLQREAAEKSVAKAWSVRQLEQVTQKMMENREPKHVDDVLVDPNVKAAIQELQRVLGTRVKIIEKPKRKGGRIEIEYYSAEDLDRIYETIVGTP